MDDIFSWQGVEETVMMDSKQQGGVSKLSHHQLFSFWGLVSSAGKSFNSLADD